MSWSKRIGRPIAAILSLSGCAYLFETRREKLPPLSGALEPGKRLSCRLSEVERLSSTTSRYRFSLPTPNHVLGLPVVSHILAVDAANIYREYTPITLDEYDKGYFDLVIRKYQSGHFSDKIFSRMNPGDALDFYGPIVKIEYSPNVAKSIGMVAGGTGITPMYQVIRTILHNPCDETKIKLVYANKHYGDIILVNELTKLEKDYPDQLEILFVVEDLPESKQSNAYASGRISSELLKHFLPEPNSERGLLFVCGPDGMMEHLCGKGNTDGSRHSADGATKPKLGGILKHLGYQDRLVIRF